MASTSTRPQKRVKQDDDPSSSNSQAARSTARLFAPFRALGFITTALPLAVQSRASARQTTGPKVTIVSSLGQSWAMWDGDKMGLLFVGPPLGKDIKALTVKFDEVFAAVGGEVVRFERGKEVDRFKAPGEDTVISQLLIFGKQLLALTEAGDELLIFNLETTELSTTIPLPKSFTAIHMLHPQTYLNKILLTSSTGALALYNIRTRTLLYNFAAPSPAPGAVTSVSQSPAIDVVAIGYASGLVRLVDLRVDEEIMSLRMEGAISSIGFRSDGEPVLATGSEDGDLAFWDLNNRGRLVHLVRTAHEGGVSTVEWIPGQSLLVTSGGDNAIRQWNFETPLSPPLLLKFREGHRAPPCLIRYYGEDGKAILTAGVDRALRMTSVVRDSRSREISQGTSRKHLLSSSETLKLPPITSLSSSSTRSKDWVDILSTHQPSVHSAIGTKGAQNHLARTWSGKDCKIGRHALAAPGGKADVASSVCVSACGNFGLVGGAKGQVGLWNLQSGQERKSFTLPPSSAEGNIVGLATDALNRVVVTASSSGTVDFFDFHTTQHLYSLVLPPTPDSPTSGGSVFSLTLQRDSNLLAIVCSAPHRVLLVDIETRRIVRELKAFPAKILDLAFSPDSRWIIAGSQDAVIRTFDIPSGSLVDAFKTESIPTSLAFSPTGDFLATSHADSVGVYLWANRAQFSEVALRAIEEGEVGEVGLPTVQGLEDDEELAGVAPVGEPEQKDLYLTPDQLSGELLTLSLLPRSKWQTLLNLEVIKARNKPKEAPKAPEQAPFFLPSLKSDSRPEERVSLADQLAGDDESGTKKDSHRFMDSNFVLETDFARKLTGENVDGDFEAFFAHLKSLSPSATDLELRSSLVSLDHLHAFIVALTQRLKSHKDFEAVQAFLAVFLKIHGDVLVQNGDELRESMEALRKEQVKEGERLGELCNFSQGVLTFVRNVQA